MKKYIKPNTELYAVELQQMIAGSGDTQTLQTQGNLGSGTGFTFGGKETSLPSSNSVWDEEE